MDHHTFDSNAVDIRQIEVITGTERRRPGRRRLRRGSSRNPFGATNPSRNQHVEMGCDHGSCLAGVIRPAKRNWHARPKITRHSFQ
jgi:hypothetical protein